MRRFVPFMFRNELDMLEMRLHELGRPGIVHVLVESPTTHRFVPKPLFYAENRERFAAWQDRIIHVTADLPEDPVPAAPGLPPAERERRAAWAREHFQRDAAWQAILAAGAADEDVVIITDCDEIPSAEALAWEGPGAVSLFMKTTLHAVDWMVPDSCISPTAVAATVGFLKAHGGHLGNVRDMRGNFPLIRDGGWHFSWTGGPEAQREKLLSATCHTELLGTAEGDLITSGERWRAGTHAAGHLPVVPVDVDGTWPAWIRERKCPESWFRPREPVHCGA